MVEFLFGGRLPCQRFVDNGYDWHELYTGHKTPRQPKLPTPPRRIDGDCSGVGTKTQVNCCHGCIPQESIYSVSDPLPIFKHASAQSRRHCCENREHRDRHSYSSLAQSYSIVNQFARKNPINPTKSKTPVLHTVFCTALPAVMVRIAHSLGQHPHNRRCHTA